MAPFDLKLWENVFQMIPDISFFETEKKEWEKLSIKILVKKNRQKINKLPGLEEPWLFGHTRPMRLEK